MGVYSHLWVALVVNQTQNLMLTLLSAVDNQHMLHYIRDKTAVPYFSNLVWFIGSHVIELDKCVQTDEE